MFAPHLKWDSPPFMWPIAMWLAAPVQGSAALQRQVLRVWGWIGHGGLGSQVREGPAHHEHPPFLTWPAKEMRSLIDPDEKRGRYSMIKCIFLSEGSRYIAISIISIKDIQINIRNQEARWQRWGWRGRQESGKAKPKQTKYYIWAVWVPCTFMISEDKTLVPELGCWKEGAPNTFRSHHAPSL